MTPLKSLSAQELDDQTKKDLAAVLVPEVVLPGHNLCEVGDPADCLWILQSGAAPSQTMRVALRLCVHILCRH